MIVALLVLYMFGLFFTASALSVNYQPEELGGFIGFFITLLVWPLFIAVKLGQLFGGVI